VRAGPRAIVILPLIGSAGLLLSQPLAAEVRVQVEGVSGELRSNVLSYLSLSRYSTSADIDEPLLKRLESRAQEEVEDALQPFGYYSPRITTSIRQEGGDWIALVTVQPGPPTLLIEATVRIDGPGADDPALQQALADHRLATGRQLYHPDYDRLKAELLRRAVSRGYLDAKYNRSDLQVDPDAHEARATLLLSTGERYRFGTVSIDQDRLDPALMRRYLRFSEGEWFDSGELLRTQFALDDSAYFGSVEVLPGERDPASLTIPVTITARGAKRNKYTVGLGYSTDQQWRVTGRWDNRLLNSSGHRLRADVAIGTTAQSYGVTYTIPVGDPALEKLEFSASQIYASPGDVHAITTQLRTALTQVRGRWQYVPFVDFAHTESEIAGTNTTSNLIVPGITVAQVPRGFMSNASPQTGISGLSSAASGVPTTAADATGFLAELLATGHSIHSDVTFVRMRVRDQWSFQIAPRWRVVLRGEVGATLVHDFEQMPVSYRFFAGGDQSVRGYAYESLSPVDAQGQKSGGKDLLVMSGEIVRDIRSNMGIAVFCDGGNALNRFGDPLAYGAGVGIRYRLPFLSMGIDLAKPLSNGGGSPRLHLNISPVF
jgi:translocation and assembly module TamA